MKLDEITGSKFPTTREQVIAACEKHEIYRWIINDDLSVDIAGDVILSHTKFKTFPVKFRNVAGSFTVASNKTLSSLEGAPNDVSGSFDCQLCPSLISLEGMPDTIGTWIYCAWKNIKSYGLGIVSAGCFMGCVNGVSKDSPFNIIANYVGKPDDILECQSELIEAGYEEYAQL